MRSALVWLLAVVAGATLGGILAIMGAPGGLVIVGVLGGAGATRMLLGKDT